MTQENKDSVALFNIYKQLKLPTLLIGKVSIETYPLTRIIALIPAGFLKTSYGIA